MDARLQRRVQRYGWDLAATHYESLWQAQLAPAQDAMLRMANLAPGEHVLDVACGTGLVSFEAARSVGTRGQVMGVDLSGQMIEAARQRAEPEVWPGLTFHRMDAEQLDLPAHLFDVALCALGLMYMPAPEQALREMGRVLRPGGRAVAAVWGPRARCAWASVFSIVDAEVASDVCPLFFRLGQAEALAQALAQTGFIDVEQQIVPTVLDYPDAETACEAAFAGGPVAMAWSRFDEATRQRARERYIASIEPWRTVSGYRLDGEFVVASGVKPAAEPLPTP